MGRLENRLRRLEEHDVREGFAAALQMASDEDISLLAGYAERALAADEAGHARPYPTPEEQEAFGRFEDLRRRAVQQGWGASGWRPC